MAKSARRLARWGRDYDNEGLARKAKQMEKQVTRLQEQQTEVSAGSRWQLRLAGEALIAVHGAHPVTIDVEAGTE